MTGHQPGQRPLITLREIEMPFDANDAETKKAVKKAVSEAVTEAVSEAVEGLKAKNSELLGKLKKAQKNAEIDPAEHAALQAELDEAQEELRASKKAEKKAVTEAEASKKSYEGESKVVHDLLVDQGLSKSLLENGIKNPSFLNAAKAMLKGQVTLESTGDKRLAKVGDKGLSEYIKEWAGSDEGKEFVSAPNNSGGGGGGGGGGNPGNENLTKMSPEARLDHINVQEAGK